VRLLGRILLRTVGTILSLVGLIAAFVVLAATDSSAPPIDSIGFPIFGFVVFVMVPFGIAYFCFRGADALYERRHERQPPRPPGPTLIEKAGLVLALLALFLLAASLPLGGRVSLLVLLLLVFARVHRGWAAPRFRTPLGWTSYAEIFDFVFCGIVYLFTFALIAIVSGGRVLTGVSPGGGGSFGGGGASGKW
jgi:hypothetical protein